MGYSKWIIGGEIGEIIHKDGFYMTRQWSYPRNPDFFSCNLGYQIYFIKFQQRENFEAKFNKDALKLPFKWLFTLIRMLIGIAIS